MVGIDRLGITEKGCQRLRGASGVVGGRGRDPPPPLPPFTYIYIYVYVYYILYIIYYILYIIYYILYIIYYILYIIYYILYIIHDDDASSAVRPGCAAVTATATKDRERTKNQERKGLAEGETPSLQKGLRKTSFTRRVKMSPAVSPA